MTGGPGRNLVVVAASAGGLEPLRTLLSGLPADLPAAVLVVLHIPASGGRTLPHILNRAGPLPAVAVVDGEPLRAARVYVAPPDRHLLVHHDMVRTSRGPRQNGVRPAADPLFRSAALLAGPRTTGVVLSGTLDDAALGAATVERRGGRVIVQDPAEAGYDSMPRSALATTEHAEIHPAAGLAAAVVRLVGAQAAAPAAGPAPELEAEIWGLLAGDALPVAVARDYGSLTCPDCGGPLNQSQDINVVSYDCLAGHRWSPRALLEEQTGTVERALWLAIRSLDERGRLTEGLAEAARQRGHTLTADRFAGDAKEARLAADVIRNAASGIGPAADAVVPDEPALGPAPPE
jgi:two-component system chemotaxis response regulator CheB